MEAMASTMVEPEHTSIALSSTPRISLSTTSTVDTAATQSTEASLYTLIAVVIRVLSVCFITTIITATVIAGCYCQRAKSQRMITNSLEPPVMQKSSSSSKKPHVNIGSDKFIKVKTDPLRDPPDPAEEEYEDINTISYPADNAQTDTQTEVYVKMV